MITKEIKMNIKEQATKLNLAFPDAESVIYVKRDKIWEVKFDEYCYEVVRSYVFENNTFRLIGTLEMEI